MTPIRLSTSLYRRFYSAVVFLSFLYVVFFGLQTTGLIVIPLGLHVPLYPAIAAGVVGVSALLCAIGIQKTASFVPAFSIFALFTILTGYLAFAHSGFGSFYWALWVTLALFSPLFGAAAWIPMLVAVGSYATWLYSVYGATSASTIGILLLMTVVPIVLGLILWRKQPQAEEKIERNVKNLTTELSEVATKSEIIINAIADGVIAIDGKGVVQLINPAAQELLGWGKQDALMLHYSTILKLHDEQGKAVDPTTDPIDQVLNTNQQARSSRLIALTESGKKLSLSIAVSPIGSMGSGAIIVFRDVTKERTEEREQAEFISTASHEMRTPVASIEGYLGLAMNPATATIDTRAQGYIIKAHEAAQHLGRLFQDLLDVSKSEDGRMTNTPRVVDISAFAGTIVQGLRQKASEKGLTLSFVPGSIDAEKKILPMYYVNLDNDHIREVLDNLIENAIKYTPSGGVQVDITGTDDKVVISIKDTGLGIPTEDIPHLFQKFYRVENSDRQQIGGTGLGLYLCRRLVEAMQGRLWVESVFGKGSTFFVELPRISSADASRLADMQRAQAPAPVAAPVATQIPVTTAGSTLAPTTPANPATTNPVKPATTVPRGESLSRDQIAERVKQLEELARKQREQQATRQ